MSVRELLGVLGFSGCDFMLVSSIVDILVSVAHGRRHVLGSKSLEQLANREQKLVLI